MSALASTKAKASALSGSGSGKSVTCLALLRLLARDGRSRPPTTLRLDGVDVLKANNRGPRRLRGRSAAMIFQDPMTAFDPVFTIGHQIAETIRAHRNVGKREALAEAEQLLLKRRDQERRCRCPWLLPAPALGRHAAARDDRHGALRAGPRC